MTILEILLAVILIPVVVIGLIWKFVIKPMFNRESDE